MSAMLRKRSKIRVVRPAAMGPLRVNESTPYFSNFNSSAPTGTEVTLDDVRRDAFERIRAPRRIAVLVDDCRADALDEIMFGDAGERHAIVLLKALLDLLE